MTKIEEIGVIKKELLRLNCPIAANCQSFLDACRAMKHHTMLPILQACIVLPFATLQKVFPQSDKDPLIVNCFIEFLALQNKTSPTLLTKGNITTEEDTKPSPLKLSQSSIAAANATNSSGAFPKGSRSAKRDPTTYNFQDMEWYCAKGCKTGWPETFNCLQTWKAKYKSLAGKEPYSRTDSNMFHTCFKHVSNMFHSGLKQCFEC
jgi:hypothetical protein